MLPSTHPPADTISVKIRPQPPSWRTMRRNMTSVKPAIGAASTRVSSASGPIHSAPVRHCPSPATRASQYALTTSATWLPPRTA